LFNLRAGFTAADDTLSEKITRQALKDGPHAGRVLKAEDLAEMKALYYYLRGWDGDGRPKTEKLQELRLQAI
jgi:aldehyde:ferredoxin oxidoreductase